MPYQEHPEFETPPDETVIWRYMDFTKFVDLLETSQLHFSLLDSLNDKLEGYLDKASIDAARKNPSPFREVTPQEWDELNSQTLRGLRMFRGFIQVSCWHENKHESAAMWKIYLKSDEGIAVRSSIGRFKQAISEAKEEVHIGIVKYGIDPLKNAMLLGLNALSPALHKRKSFEHEHEIRAVLTQPESQSSTRINVDIHSLIEAVFVAPGTSGWILSLVQNVAKRYQLSAPVFPSVLDDDPPY